MSIEPSPYSAIRVPPEEYSVLFDPFAHAFNTTAFARLNREKVEELHHIAIGRPGKAPVAGIILGQRDNLYRSPFSAPFGGFTFKDGKNPRFSVLTSVVSALADYGYEHQKGVVVTPPPTIYSPDLCDKLTKAFLDNHFVQAVTDLSYQLECTSDQDYTASLRRNGVKDLRAAMKAGLEFSENISIDRAYSVIQANRHGRGYPLRMSLQQVKDTSGIIGIECFAVSHNSQDLAAAIVYRVTADIAQVVYWGDIPDKGNMHSVNFLAANLVNWYASKGVSVLDIGPATEEGVPNLGLCDFKENIGCKACLKPTFYRPFIL